MAVDGRTVVDKMKIRRWNRGDLDQIAGLWLELANHINPLDGFYQIAPDARAKYTDYLRRVFGDRDHMVFVADAGEGLAGFAMGRVNRNPSVVVPDRVGYIENVFIQSDKRRSGIGKALCERLLEWFRGKRITHVELFYQTENSGAAAFWHRMGFRTWLAKAYKAV